MINCVVFWTRIKYIYPIVNEIDAVDTIVVLLHHWQKELHMIKNILGRKK